MFNRSAGDTTGWGYDDPSIPVAIQHAVSVVNADSSVLNGDYLIVEMKGFSLSPVPVVKEI